LKADTFLTVGREEDLNSHVKADTFLTVGREEYLNTLLKAVAIESGYVPHDRP